MVTQLDYAKAGIVTDAMRRAVDGEPLTAEQLRDAIAEGHAVLPKNIHHEFATIRAIGRGLKTKVNANLGASGECADVALERRKLAAAIKAGADSVMDLSTGGDLEELRAMYLREAGTMVGTVPIYAVATDMVRRGIPLEKMDPDDLFAGIEAQCRQGVDYITVHCGVTQASAKKLEHFQRIMPCVSRGGSILLYWMRRNRTENPLYQDFDVLLDIAHAHDVTLSLGDGFRPGAIADAIDGPQIEELMILAELARRARARGVQVMIEGPGHVPLEHIQAHVQLEKKLCDGAPFYVLGPLPTDIAAGYDHITAAVGGALAGAAGADFLCYVTPAEHLGLPDEDDVYQGVMAARIAAHIADLAKGIPGAMARDRAMSQCRRALDWDGMIAAALDPHVVKRRLQVTEDRQGCSMCGKLCAVKLAVSAVG
uniref:Phosphomethylpyrimidine synthase n=1 Tax=Desulfacinum infernum TaxID=35837 RepID=A0A831ZJY9_9BACT